MNFIIKLLANTTVFGLIHAIIHMLHLLMYLGYLLAEERYLHEVGLSAY
jgi:hypothetical protein